MIINIFSFIKFIIGVWETDAKDLDLNLGIIIKKKNITIDENLNRYSIVMPSINKFGVSATKYANITNSPPI